MVANGFGGVTWDADKLIISVIHNVVKSHIVEPLRPFKCDQFV